MKRGLAYFASSAVVALGVFATSRDASAQYYGRPPPPPPPYYYRQAPPPPTYYVYNRPAPPPPDYYWFDPVTIEWNPLAVALGKVSFNVEILPVPHHALVLSPFISSAHPSFNQVNPDGSTTEVSNTPLNTSVGGEIGYHWWSGNHGANGFFIGPSLIAFHTDVSACDGCVTNSSFATYGAALDLGGQHIFQSGFTIGGGIGLQYLTSNNGYVNSPNDFYRYNGVSPRFLFSIGWSF